jgi:hypothetical protein
MTPRTSVRTLVEAVFANGRLTEEVTPLATVNEVALPITVPAAFTKEIVPVQDAVSVVEDVALFVTLIWAVSVLANPTGGKLEVCVRVVVVVVVWAIATAAVNSVEAISTVNNRRNSIVLTFLVVCR